MRILLSKFSNEVLSNGPQAVLPQNLSSEWLSRIQKMVDDFLDANFEGGNCRKAKFTADPVLATCVSEILRHLKGASIDIQENDMFEKLTLYALSVTVESVAKEVDIKFQPPTLETIFDKRRLQDLVDIRPEFEPIIQTVCMDNS
jgi:hypothetical protein